MKPRIPAEWEPHEAVWLAWPHDTISFGSLSELEGTQNTNRLRAVEKTFLEVIGELTKSEHVHLIVRDVKAFPHILPGVTLHEADYADIWTRDYLPMFTGTAAVKWQYNAYGSKFPDLRKDNSVWSTLNKTLRIPTLESEIVLEPGAVELNGEGILLTTEQCLLKRNQTMRKADYEKLFSTYLGISRTIWLKEGMSNDHTDGHIDEIARFVSPNKALCVFEQDYELLKKDFEVTILPLPHLVYNDGNQAPTSYANFYISNKSVLVPTFRDPHDAEALEIIQSLFPDREVIGIDCVDLIYGGGTLHCMTQQVPRP